MPRRRRASDSCASSPAARACPRRCVLVEIGVDLNIHVSTHSPPQSNPPTPQDGFAALDPAVNIASVGLGADEDEDDDPQTFRLPMAHTCSRTLDLPVYPTKEILFERLTLALAYVEAEFGMA